MISGDSRCYSRDLQFCGNQYKQTPEGPHQFSGQIDTARPDAAVAKISWTEFFALGNNYLERS